MKKTATKKKPQSKGECNFEKARADLDKCQKAGKGFLLCVHTGGGKASMNINSFSALDIARCIDVILEEHPDVLTALVLKKLAA